jgi:UDPglucose--hexose-1-phosphate uridylyltransferase
LIMPLDQAELRVDPLSGRIVVFAPDRRRRPGATPHGSDAPLLDELATCPFCAGHEARTPPEVFRIESDGGWLVRVVPNLYPGLARQEVVIHSPRHARTFAELNDDEIGAVAAAWTARREAARDEGFDYVHAFVNEGAGAGSSLPHSHSQLVWLHEPPPERAHEAAHAAAALLSDETLLIAETDGMRAGVHRYGRLPYETIIGSPESDLNLAVALRLLREFVRRLRALEGPVPWNAWLHDDHLEVVPRLTVLAGLELGAGIYVNTVAPEEAAEALRAADLSRAGSAGATGETRRPAARDDHSASRPGIRAGPR